MTIGRMTRVGLEWRKEHGTQVGCCGFVVAQKKDDSMREDSIRFKLNLEKGEEEAEI